MMRVSGIRQDFQGRCSKLNIMKLDRNEEAARNLFPSDYKCIDEHYGAFSVGPAREDVPSIGVATTANQSIGLELSTKYSKGDFAKEEFSTVSLNLLQLGQKKLQKCIIFQELEGLNSIS